MQLVWELPPIEGTVTVHFWYRPRPQRQSNTEVLLAGEVACVGQSCATTPRPGQKESAAHGLHGPCWRGAVVTLAARVGCMVRQCFVLA